MRKGKLIEILWFVVILGLFILSIQMIRSGQLQEQIGSFGIWAPVVVVVLKISTLVIAPLGGSPLYLIAGALFGNVNGFIICFTGDVLGSAACFFISRKYGQKVVKFFVGENFFVQVNQFLNILDNTKSFLKARAALFTLPEIFAYAAGLSRVNFVKFIIIHSIFMIPLAAVGVFFGSQLAALTAKYSIFASILVVVILFAGSWMFYKDYQKTEGM